jgi:hypothetical protein
MLARMRPVRNARRTAEASGGEVCAALLRGIVLCQQTVRVPRVPTANPARACRLARESLPRTPREPTADPARAYRGPLSRRRFCDMMHRRFLPHD